MIKSTQSKMGQKLFSSAPSEDKGSEAIYGFDYQKHCIARTFLDMLTGVGFQAIVCEYKEDFLKVATNDTKTLCQVKKRESVNTWTLKLITPALAKLFNSVTYKDVSALILYGSGRPASEGDVSLDNLIALLECELQDRDSDWEGSIQPYEDWLFQELAHSHTQECIRKGLRILNIDLTQPNPESIETENIKETIDAISKIWTLSVNFVVAQQVYDGIYRRICNACNKPKQPLRVKRITVVEARSLMASILKKCEVIPFDLPSALDTAQKLRNGDLSDCFSHVLSLRMDALQTRFELELDTVVWQDLKDDIQIEWQNIRQTMVGSQGTVLWKHLRSKLRDVDNRWIEVRGKAFARPGFAEGVFFDMLATCSADFRT